LRVTFRLTAAEFWFRTGAREKVTHRLDGIWRFSCMRERLPSPLSVAERAMIIYTPPTPPKSIPVIDLAGMSEMTSIARADAAAAIHRACRETGFFYIANHGVSAGLIAGQFAAARRFFDLPLAEKTRLHMKQSPTTAGYEPVGGQILDSQDANSEKAPPDLKESFYCGRDIADDHPYALKKWRGLGHNQWPDLPGFREQTTAYYAALCDLGDHVLSLVAQSLELSPDWFAPHFEWPGATLRFIKYPPQPVAAAYNQIGAGAHTDGGGITLLAQDASGGLEVQTVAGDWIEATPIPGTFVINLGDLMARWTNGIYNSNMHRVKNNRGGSDRYSLPFFYSPRADAVIEPIPTCVTPEHPRKFETCTSSQHMLEMFRRSYGYAPTA
jgi:isopenicillin N synthase-like dioxygenase